MNLQKLLERFSDLLFPKICQNCGEPFQEGLSNILCCSCFKSITPYEDPVCDHCGISLPIGAFEDAVVFRCRDCGEEDYLLDKVRSVGPYQGALRIAHHGFKFEGMENFRSDLAKKMVEATIPPFWEGVEALVPVPLSADRKRERGYNPADLLAQEVSRMAGIPMEPILMKIRATKPQMSLSRGERLKNPKGAYHMDGKGPFPKKAVLVDDVLTTGATLEECARVLKSSGVSWVGAIVFGRTPHHF